MQGSDPSVTSTSVSDRLISLMSCTSLEEKQEACVMHPDRHNAHRRSSGPQHPCRGEATARGKRCLPKAARTRQPAATETTTRLPCLRWQCIVDSILLTCRGTTQSGSVVIMYLSARLSAWHIMHKNPTLSAHLPPRPL